MEQKIEDNFDEFFAVAEICFFCAVEIPGHAGTLAKGEKEWEN